jgi:glucose-6-phosphate 1-epimerase
VVLEEERDEGHTHIRLQLQSSADTLEQWPYLFDLYLDVTVGDELSIALSVTNKDSKTFEISTALHTYFQVSDINTIRIRGLDASRYYNALDDRYYEQKGDILIQKEADRVYLDPSEIITVLDGESTVQLKQEGSHSLVVWNPWIEKSEKMTDMTADGYRSMVCLETSNAREDSRVLMPNETHVLKAIISQGMEK